ncbi:MAG: redoxin family protein [Acidobacteriota bacterium]
MSVEFASSPPVGYIHLMRLLCAIMMASLINVAPSTQDDEHAPIVERAMDFLDFTLKTVGGEDFNLRRFAEGKKLIIVGFVAGWCKNSNQNGHVIKRLADKYRERGLGVVIVSEYSSPEEMRIHIGRIGIDYPVVVETDRRDRRKKSAHYDFRRAAGDNRKWGTPFYVLIDARDIEPAPSRTLARRVHTVSGEIIESQAEAFIERRISQ